jgi:short-subunit dehydrogenase
MATNGASKPLAVVTGASSGLGEVFARDLVQRGYSVLAVARREDRLKKLAGESGGSVEPLVADLGTSAGLDAVVRRVSERGGADLLVNNAGFANYGKFLGSPVDREIAQIRLNIEAVVVLTSRLTPAMVKRGSGGVIFIASALGFGAVPFFASYGGTKAFILNFSQALAFELQGSGVKIHVVCPGPIKTECYAVSKSQKTVASAPMATPEKIAKTALDSWAAGKVMAIPGAPNRILTFLPRILPRSTMRSIMASMMKP